ncbi:hypothetical protein PS1M3_25890 [Pseudoalteromonas sp. PS1M3]|jgi:hypothetical protein|uniref:hypothetical protein n=1 Tax=Pseudoalteromonas sp. PS1M3 TaxID=87791 RepID=UPI00195140EE|nr:hypothetical protein [Pseudoalteromonas sp. PS1M3]BBW92502.1 hypothetical protein PS1M3_25890 [Pseudoalteromonas sp. PS1M3]
MKAAIYITLITLALSSVGAQANPNKDNHGQHQGKKVGHKKHKHHDHNSLSKKEKKQLLRAGWTPPGLTKRYHRGDYLDRNVYKQGRVIERSRDNGTVSIKIDSTVIHMVHDTREILSILTR